MQPKLKFFDVCVTAGSNLSASSMCISMMVGRPSSATCKSRIRRQRGDICESSVRATDTRIGPTLALALIA